MFELSLLGRRNEELFAAMQAAGNPDMQQRCEAHMELIPLCIPYYCREVVALIENGGYSPMVYRRESSYDVVIYPREGMMFDGEWYGNFDLIIRVKPSDRPNEGQEWADEWVDLAKARPLDRLMVRTVKRGVERFELLDMRRLVSAGKLDWLLSILGAMMSTGGGHYDREFRSALSDPIKFREKEIARLVEIEAIERRNARLS